MISAFRRSLLLLVTAVFVLLSTIPMATLPLLHGGDDTACDPHIVVHDSSAHYLNGANGALPVEAEHCVICHWSQWVRGIQGKPPSVSPSFDSHLVSIVCAPRLQTTTLSRSGARAPPLS
jgi:hypothetical protein